MTDSALAPDPRVVNVGERDGRLEVTLRDGRTIAVPLNWFPQLAAATPQARARWEPSAAGYGIHWPDLDEDLIVEGLLKGYQAK